MSYGKGMKMAYANWKKKSCVMFLEQRPSQLAYQCIFIHGRVFFDKLITGLVQ